MPKKLTAQQRKFKTASVKCQGVMKESKATKHPLKVYGACMKKELRKRK